MNIVSSSKLHEQWTLYVNTNGQPVQRSLSEMTPAEVMACLDWHADQEARLDREAKPALETLHALEAGTLDPTSLPKQTLSDYADAMHRASQASETLAYLMEQVNAILHPQWQRHPGMGLGTAIRRFWPGGR